jgi:hypothetical protein
MKIALNQANRLKKILIIFSGAITIGVVVVILFISPITKYLIQKYDEKYTGRQITIDWAYVNPFTGYFHFKNLKVCEYKSDSIFISLKGLSGNISIHKLFSKTIEVNNFTLDLPRIIIIKTKGDFNFSDLVTLFSSKRSLNALKKPFHFNFINVKINNGHFFYTDQVIPVHYSIKEVEIESKDGWRWDNDVISAKVACLTEKGTGRMKADYSINLKSLDFTLDVVLNKFDVKVFEQYLKQIANYGTFNANLDANLKTNGNYKDPEDINIKGEFAINDFHLGKDTTEDYLSFKKLAFTLDDLNPRKRKYYIDSMLLIHPYFKYEQYDKLDNLETMFGIKGANILNANANVDAAKFNLVIQIGRYIKIIAQNFFKSYYKINRLEISKGEFKFNDYSLSEKFTIIFNPISVVADSIDKNHERVDISFKSGIEPFGNAVVNLSINPKDSSDFDMNYHLQKLAISMFNPYLIAFSSFPLDRGTMELTGKWNVRDGIVKSNNHVLIIDPRVTKRLKNNNNKWIPLPLAMFFMRERSNVIDYDIPITGNLKNPKFHFNDVLSDLFKNIFIKPPTAAYGLQVKNLESEIEKSLTVKWEMRYSSLRPNQIKFIEKMADFLVKHPEEIITVHPKQYALKEKEYILFFEMKKKYFLMADHKSAESFSREDSAEVDKMSIKLPLFDHFLDKQVKDTMLFTVQEKCSRIIGPAIVNAKFEQLNRERINAFMSEFRKSGVDKQIRIGKSENVIPYDGFSFYQIDYKGEFPDALIKAYSKMNDLNEESPRKKFSEDRRKIKSAQ